MEKAIGSYPIDSRIVPEDEYGSSQRDNLTGNYQDEINPPDTLNPYG